MYISHCLTPLLLQIETNCCLLNLLHILKHNPAFLQHTSRFIIGKHFRTISTTNSKYEKHLSSIWFAFGWHSLNFLIFLNNRQKEWMAHNFKHLLSHLIYNINRNWIIHCNAAVWEQKTAKKCPFNNHHTSMIFHFTILSFFFFFSYR